DCADHLQNLIELRSVFWATPSGPHAKSRRSEFFRLNGTLFDFGNGHQRRRFHRCLEMGRLRTIPAILRATARFDAEQGAALNVVGRMVVAMNPHGPPHEFGYRQMVNALQVFECRHNNGITATNEVVERWCHRTDSRLESRCRLIRKMFTSSSRKDVPVKSV